MSGLITQNEMVPVMRLADTVTLARREICEAEAAGNNVLRAMVTARAIKEIRNQMGTLLKELKPLAGTKLGFKTDRQYSDDVLRDILIEAMLDGARVVGNEFTIIDGGYYRNKEQLFRRIQEWPGLTDWKCWNGAPSQKVNESRTVLVPVWATWRLDGRAQGMRCCKDGDDDARIAVHLHETQKYVDKVDTIIGKAKSKFYRRVLETLSGAQWEEPAEAIDGSVARENVIAEADTPEPQPEADEQDFQQAEAAEFLAHYLERLGTADTPKEVNAIYRECLSHEWTPEEKGQLEVGHWDAMARVKRGNGGELFE